MNPQVKSASVVVCLVYLTIQLTQASQQENIESALKLLDQLKETRHGLTALKRVVTDIDEDIRNQHSLNDLTRKRKGLQMLQRILDEMENDLIYEQKRTCQFNLGGHCATESAANVADHWHYLNSPLSPGRKRRDTRLYKRLVAGKLFQ